MNIIEGKMWYKYCEKNIFLEKLYGKEIPRFEKVKIHSFNMDLSYGKEYIPSAQFSVIIKEMPKNMPKKWCESRIKEIEIVLEVVEISSIDITFTKNEYSGLEIMKNNENIVLNFKGGVLGEIRCPLEYEYHVEDCKTVVDDKCFAISAIRGVVK